MLSIIEQIIENVPRDILTEDILMNLLEKSSNSRYGVIKRAIAKKELIHIRRGLYVMAKKYQRKNLNIFELAQWIYGPSYVSFESALSYHGCIPESVYAVTSVCSKNAKEFRTPQGIFTYKRIPYPVLYLGVERVVSGNSTFFMASPLKAILDYVYAYRKNWQNISPLIKSLRIEEDTIYQWNYDLLGEFKEQYKNYRVQRFLKGLEKDLNL